MIRMNATLLSKLFVEPMPQPERPDVLAIYQLLSNRMFPGKEDFIEYLQTQSYDKQYELAERIIHRLCYYSNFPPSYFALKDIICLEGYQKDSISYTDKYVPRDHFAHLLNLYLLGIYVFFYNSEFYDKIVHANRYERKNNTHFQPKLDAVKDFVSEWKYFCLYHDVGYAQEIFGNSQYVKNAKNSYTALCKRANDFQSSLSQGRPIKQNAFFGALEIMSRLFVWKYVLDYSSDQITADNKLFRFFKRERLNSCLAGEICEAKSFEDEVGDFLSNTYRLEKIYSNQCIKPLLPVFGEKNIVVIGIHKDTGEVAFISFEAENGRKLLFLQKYQLDSDIHSLCNDASLALFDDYSPRNYELEYLVDKNQSSAEFYSQVLFDQDNLESTLEYFAEHNLESKFAGISSEQKFLDFYFDVYICLYEEIRKYLFPSKPSADSTKPAIPAKKKTDPPKLSGQAKKLENYLNSGTDIFELASEDLLKYNEKLTDLIYSLLQNSYTDDVKNECVRFIREINVPNDKSKASDSEELIRNIVENYFSTIEGVVSSDIEKEKRITIIKDSYSAKIKRAASFIKVYCTLYTGLKSIFEGKSVAPFAYVFNYSKRTETLNPTYMEKLLNEKALRQLKFKSGDVIAKYDNGFSKFDHGFESVKYAAGIFELMRAGIESLKDSKEWMLIDILFSISGRHKTDEYVASYISNYDHIFSEVLFAIFIHNIYPGNFKEDFSLRKMKTTITDPFSYLALLCDALQQWNRPQSISPSLLELKPSEHASDQYNIVVKSDGIYLFEQGTEKSQNRIMTYINEMTHLKNVKAFLKNGYVMGENE